MHLVFFKNTALLHQKILMLEVVIPGRIRRKRRRRKSPKKKITPIKWALSNVQITRKRGRISEAARGTTIFQKKAMMVINFSRNNKKRNPD